ncbi:cobalamin-binding protein [Tuwongella immobilis]|uniref:Fe/B12 periplasmic-binding domain-containing protein n=1 Tax=Tuwongella immobilis TaxID=692036 RepID=A0A6C2YU10_9BACT|nr:cobalamin-binding protein [Tuwongella immobilis]VIP04519.1 abc transporter substrate-binding protein : ABC-type Fe3+-hydroxamate transport system, periplasmic component OS=Chloracidobacterium thermophilum (strain B) GN=Cabther_B0043 PE=4 SV=1: Peripla_BP_2 [Tuwongella immobilis]VTS06400.1 abc transporter substrate-binding protein : ABC-type Fe3+-hydroxamate transport system, periplasmic component OS=Chloracidobacterium thermophilum (strain B) GN=Cabther_B0043 PE=4 SV=1: Peripla_BP_2 [Tuwongell
MRIVSLLPSATELLDCLQLGEQLVGVTHECDYPEWVGRLPKVTRTLIPHDASSQQIDALVRERLQTQKALYTLDLPTLEQLRPDWIVTQALCDVCAVAEAEVTAAACSLPGQPSVINLEPMSLADVLATLRLIGERVGIVERAEAVIAGLQARIDAVARRSAAITNRPRGVILEWIDPPFCCGHWSPELMDLAGGIEVIGVAGQPSRTITPEMIAEAKPEFVLIACCGFSLERTRQDLSILRNYPGFADWPATQSGRIYLTDGNAFFSRPGPRLVDSLELLAHALHPDIHPLPANVPAAIRLDG